MPTLIAIFLILFLINPESAWASPLGDGQGRTWVGAFAYVSLSTLQISLMLLLQRPSSTKRVSHNLLALSTVIISVFAVMRFFESLHRYGFSQLWNILYYFLPFLFVGMFTLIAKRKNVYPLLLAAEHIVAFSLSASLIAIPVFFVLGVLVAGLYCLTFALNRKAKWYFPLLCGPLSLLGIAFCNWIGIRDCSMRGSFQLFSNINDRSIFIAWLLWSTFQSLLYLWEIGKRLPRLLSWSPVESRRFRTRRVA